MLIGWACADLTPTRPVALRGQHTTRISEAVRDPLSATVLALAAGPDAGPEGQAVLISVDRSGIPSHIACRVTEAVAARVPDLDAQMILMNATHSHSAPELEEGFYLVDDHDVMPPTEYADLFVERVAQAVVEAWERRAPGGVSRGLGHAVVGHNRRTTYADGTSRMYGPTDREDFECMEGYEDHSVDMLFTWDSAGALTGMVINLACPSQVTEGDLFVSADFWHETRCELRARHGEGLFILPQCAPAGDQSPHLLLYKQAEQTMRERRGLSERAEIARRLANAVDDVLPFAGEIQPDACVVHLLERVQLPARMVTAAEVAEAARQLAELEQQDPAAGTLAERSYRHIMMWRARRVLERHAAQATRTTCEFEVHAMRIGDMALATNPFELFLDYGLRIKARSKADQTFLVQLTASRVSPVGGYLPTARSVTQGSYGAQIADGAVGPVGGQALVEATLRAIDRLFE